MWKISLAALLAPAVLGTHGVDLSTGTDHFKCMEEHGEHFVVTRAWHSYGGADTTAPHNLARARDAGIKYRDVYMFPCRGKSATGQVRDMLSYLRGHAEVPENYKEQ